MKLVEVFVRRPALGGCIWDRHIDQMVKAVSDEVASNVPGDIMIFPTNRIATCDLSYVEDDIAVITEDWQLADEIRTVIKRTVARLDVSSLDGMDIRLSA